MITETEQEMNRIREALVPAAEELRVIAKTVPTLREFADQTKADVRNMRSYAKEFTSDVDRLFPAKIDLSQAASPSEHLKKSRHDARNRLNHLFNLVQLLQISKDFPHLSESIGALAKQLDRCLAILSASASEVSTEPASTAPVVTANTTDDKIEKHPHPGVILIADDNAENRTLLARLLEPAGHTIHFAKDGVEAIEKIGKTLYDAVLLDIEMPKMDGYEVLHNLRESGHLRQTPVIVVTALEGVQEAIRCIEIGAEDFLSRPIHNTFLMARLNASLEKKRLREQVFEQHFTPELARELARNPDPMKMQARNQDVSLLFCDIRRFSSISERMGPAQTVDWLSTVMGEFSTRVIDLGGVLVDYTGDEVLAMWGAPNHQPNHAELACTAALDIMDSLVELNKTWAPIVGAETCVGIGVNTGEALVGNIGTHRKFKYGPLGTTVNLASRVQGATKYLKTSLLITGATASQLSPKFRRRRLCQVKVHNIQKPVDLYELSGKDVDRRWSRLGQKYEEALRLYETNQLRESSALLSRVLVETPHDGPCLQLMRRVVDSMILDLPADEFSPVWELEGK